VVWLAQWFEKVTFLITIYCLSLFFLKVRLTNWESSMGMGKKDLGAHQSRNNEKIWLGTVVLNTKIWIFWAFYKISALKQRVDWWNG
jgi:hypothetical protein